MVKFNPYSKWLGFRYHLFDKIDEATVRGLVDDINRYKPKLLLVFPSPMNMIAHTIRRYGLELKHQPALINVSGETFFDCQRKNIGDVFPNSKVEDSYGSVELGELAHETDGGGLEIFANVAYVETEPNEAGQPEMVITRLKLTDFPFIRYKMKDIADVEFRRDARGSRKICDHENRGQRFKFHPVGSGRAILSVVFQRAGQRFEASVTTPLLKSRSTNAVNGNWKSSTFFVTNDIRNGSKATRRLLQRADE